nr:MsnO8 family LLM class oxidoreductase [Allobranchiibius huperziae]
MDLGQALEDCRPEARVALTVQMAELAEDRGMTRYWVAEHHNTQVGLAAPEVVLAVIAAQTTSIAVGSGGVLLQYYSPLKIAEVYLTLAASFPGRVELGVCRGPGVADDAVRLELVSGHDTELAADVYDTKVADLVRFLDPSEDLGPLEPAPRGVSAPPLWVLGSSSSSIAQAIRHRSRYGYMCFFPGSDEIGPPLIEEYLAGLGTDPADGPIITVSVICGRTEDDAQAMHSRLRSAGYMVINVVGDPGQCVAAIEALCERYHARSVLVALVAQSGAEQLEQLRRLAGAVRH